HPAAQGILPPAPVPPTTRHAVWLSRRILSRSSATFQSQSSSSAASGLLSSDEVFARPAAAAHAGVPCRSCPDTPRQWRPFPPAGKKNSAHHKLFLNTRGSAPDVHSQKSRADNASPPCAAA